MSYESLTERVEADTYPACKKCKLALLRGK